MVEVGARRLEVQLEQPLKTFPEQIALAPLRVSGAVKETAEIGAAPAPGIALKTAELIGLREIPVNQLPARSDEQLAYASEQPDWKLSLATERMAARIVADVFNLVTIGDGIVGGSVMGFRILRGRDGIAMSRGSVLEKPDDLLLTYDFQITQGNE